MKRSQKGFAHVGAILLAAVVLAIGVSGWWVYSKNKVSNPEPDIVPTQKVIKKEDAKTEESVVDSYHIEELGIYMDLESGWTVDKKVATTYEETRYTFASNIEAEKLLDRVTIVAFRSVIPAGFEGCSADSDMTTIKVTELSDTNIDGVVVFGTDNTGIALAKKSMKYASSTKSLTAERLTIGELEVGKSYFLCTAASPPPSWSVDFDSDAKNQDGVYASAAEGDGIVNSSMSGYDSVLKMLKSVRR